MTFLISFRPYDHSDSVQTLKIGFAVTLFEKGENVKSVSGSQRAHMALLAAREINNRTDILPSYEVSFSFCS